MKKPAIIFFSIIAVSLLAFFIFAPAFRGELQINSVIELGNFQIRWYGLIMAAAILASYFTARKHSWKFGISKNDVDDYSFWVVIAGVLGARIYFVLFNWDYFSQNLSETYKIWHGGLAIYGAILFGLAFSYFYAKRKAYAFQHLFDLVALAIPLGQAIGRLGNFANQEAFGVPTNLPWKMYVDPQFRPAEYSQAEFFHPAFLYEGLFDLLVFYILYRLLGKAKPGTLALMYLVIYSFGRFFIEGIRLDSFFVRGFRVDQVVAFVLFVICGFLLLQRYTGKRVEK